MQERSEKNTLLNTSTMKTSVEADELREEIKAKVKKKKEETERNRKKMKEQENERKEIERNKTKNEIIIYY